ncbi:Non-ribosomal peptide synthetase module [Candidatus Burkholderia humilis]|nr:Non-ribosomal peptide synthetase module [Candidatus Burkholderia humilis]
MVMLVVFGATLRETSGKREIRIGKPVSNRYHEQAQSVISYFINMQVLRVAVHDDASLRNWITRAREAVLGAYDYGDVPYDRLVSALLPARAHADDALFQVKITEQREFSLDAFALLTARLKVIANDMAHFALALDFVDRASGIECVLAFDDAFLDDAFIHRVEEAMRSVVERLVSTPEVIAEPSARDDDVLALWHRNVAHHADRIAVRDEVRTMTYRELDAAANALASRLLDAGCKPEGRVAVFAPRSVEMVLGMLACFKAGATWVPLDPQLPAARHAAQVKDSGAFALLHAGHYPAELASSVNTALPLSFDDDANAMASPRIIHPHQAAYLIYTSGSTGTPKGVSVSHASLGNYVRAMLETIGVNDGAAFAMVSTPAADLGHTALFGALCSAGTLHLISPDNALNPDLFAAYMTQHRIDVLKIVPSHLSALLSASDARAVLPARALIVGGEATSAALLAQIKTLGPSCRIFNHYGPTETTVGIAMHAMSAHHDS